MDRLEDRRFTLRRFTREFKDSIPISGLTGEGIDLLKERIRDVLSHLITEVEFTIPHRKLALMNLIYKEGKVKKCEYSKNSIRIEARVPKVLAARIQNELN